MTSNDRKMLKRRGLIQGTDLVLQQRQVVDRIEDHIFPVVGTGVSGNDPGAATDNHLVDGLPPISGPALKLEFGAG